MLTADRIEETPFGEIRALIAKGAYEQAMVELSQEVAQHPCSGEPWAMVAQILSIKCQYADALRATREALTRDPGHVWAQELQTGILLQLEHREDALAAAERLAALSPDRPESLAFLAFAQAFNGHDRSASNSARKCLKMSPQRGIGHQAMCVVHLAFRRWDKAERHAAAAIRTGEGPIASLYHDLGVAQFEQGKYLQAHHSMERAAQLDQRFQGAAKRFAKRVPSGVAPIPVFITMAAGIAAVPFGTMPLLFIAVALLGFVSLMIAAKRTGRAATLHPDVLRPALWGVLGIDSLVALYHLNLFG